VMATEFPRDSRLRPICEGVVRGIISFICADGVSAPVADDTS
jgi:hypothetical protein